MKKLREMDWFECLQIGLLFTIVTNVIVIQDRFDAFFKVLNSIVACLFLFRCAYLFVLHDYPNEDKYPDEPDYTEED